MRRLLVAITLIILVAQPTFAEEKDTPRAAKMRKILKLKLKDEIFFEDQSLKDCIAELQDFVKEADRSKTLTVVYDSANGVSRNTKLSYKAPVGKTVEEVLDGMLKKLELGYIVISQNGNAYDGSVQIRKGDERGYPKKKDK